MGWVNLPDNINVDELYHHGVKGQKRGLRRWQNLDGSYTPAGRIHYGIGIRKRLAKRAQEREEDKAKTEALKTIAYSAKQQRAEAQLAAHKAQIEAEKAKKELRDAKRENSKFADITRKIHEKQAAKRDKAEADKSEQETNRKADAYVDAVQSGDKKQIEKVAKSLNNDEYRAAIERVNMKYELERAATDAKIAKGKQVVSKLTNTADAITKGVDIYNATAGIISAFSGKSVPKISTKYEDPIDRLKKKEELAAKKYETEQKMETARSQREIANQNKYKADVERAKSEKDQYDWHEELSKRESDKKDAAQQKRAEEVLRRLSEPKPGMGYGKFPIKTKDVSGPSMQVSKKQEDVDKSFNIKLPDDRTYTPINSGAISVSKKNKAKEMANGYRKVIGNTSIQKYMNAFNNNFADGTFDIKKLPKDQQQMFFAMLNSKL